MYIVFGHTGLDTSFMKFFYVSIFFFMSGYLFKEKDFKSFIKKQITRLYIPFIIYNSLILFSHNFFVKIGIMNNLISINEMLKLFFKTFLFQIPDILGAPSWFIFALFITNILFYLIIKLLKKFKICKNIILIPLFIILFILGLKYRYLLNMFIYGNCPIITVFMISSLFYCCGYIINKENIINKLEKFKWLNFIIFIISSSILFYISNYTTYTIDYRAGTTSSSIIMILSSILGIYWTIYLSREILQKWNCLEQVLSIIGKNSIYIVLLQGYFFQIITFIQIKYFNVPLLDYGWINICLNRDLWKYSATLCGILFPILLSLIINNIKHTHNKKS